MRRARLRGFTLIEVLVSVLVLSVGLLGAAAMLLGSLHGASSARRELAVASLLRDVAERIAANPAGRAAYAAASAADPAGCDVAPCDAATRAAADRAWFDHIARAALAATSTAITFVPATGVAAPDRYVITLSFAADDDELPGDISLAVLTRAPVAG
jgi:type IV pilus modification protein PilV